MTPILPEICKESTLNKGDHGISEDNYLGIVPFFLLTYHLKYALGVDKMSEDGNFVVPIFLQPLSNDVPDRCHFGT